MCLGIPGKIVAEEQREGLRIGRVQFGRIIRQASLDFVPEAKVGDNVLVHVGFAVSRVEQEEAERAYQLLDEIATLQAAIP